MGEEDILGAVLKENVRKCREKIQKRMQRGDVIVTTIAWKAVLIEMRKKSWVHLLSKEVEGNLRAWFELREEFPTERTGRESTNDPSFQNMPQSRRDLVQPGDLWMDCGSFQQEDVLLGSRSSDISSMDSSTRYTPEANTIVQDSHNLVNGEDSCETKRESGALFRPSDIVCTDDNKFHNEKILDEILCVSKPWWSDMVTSSTEQSEFGAAFTNNVRDGKNTTNRELLHSKCSDGSKNSMKRATVLEKSNPSGSSYFSLRTSEVFNVGSRKGTTGRRKDSLSKMHPKSSNARRKAEAVSWDISCSNRKAQPSPLPRNKKAKLKKRRKERSCLVKQSHEQSSSSNVSDEARNLEEKPKIDFPPVGYVYKRGDWVAHAIVSSSASSEDLRQALEDRGYELKHILRRKCTLPNKWVCSCVVSADRTHILTSENIWLKGWEVDFVCNLEEILSFLDE